MGVDCTVLVLCRSLGGNLKAQAMYGYTPFLFSKYIEQASPLMPFWASRGPLLQIKCGRVVTFRTIDALTINELKMRFMMKLCC